jgi:N-formylglutamate deformylase
MSGWLYIHQGDAPLLVSLPHTGTDLADIAPQLKSKWLAQRDTDWWIEQLYDFAIGLGASVARTCVSLYPGQATTTLCPTTTFDGDALYLDGQEPDEAEIARRKALYFDPYDLALHNEVARLRRHNKKIVLYDCHSIRSVIPRLFEGELPVFNLGTNDGKSAAPALQKSVSDIIMATGKSAVVNGRFKGGWITRSFGQPERGVHALQMELSCRSYMREPVGPVSEANWPTPYDAEFAAPMKAHLTDILKAALNFARTTEF